MKITWKIQRGKSDKPNVNIGVGRWRARDLLFYTN